VVDSADASTDTALDTLSDATLADRPDETSSEDSGAPDVGAGEETTFHDAEGGSPDAADAGEGAVEAEAGLAAPSLGTASTFAILASSTVTNTGTATAVVGDVGLSPGTALVGLTAGQVTGTIYLGDAVAAQAEADQTTAYNNLVGLPCQHTMTSVDDLGGKTLPPGVYCFAVSAAQTVGDLTLDGQGDPNAVWIFQIGSTLTIGSNLSTTMINGGSACNVYWQVGSSATINGGAQFKGNILAQASISLLTGANVSPGRIFAQTAAVTIQSSAISIAGCP
jgi:type VI secretion system secreted protein VgrG